MSNGTRQSRPLPNDQYEAALNANSPSAANPFLTQADIPTITGGIYAASDSSINITFATGPSSLIGTGVGSLSVPANGFNVADSFHAVLACYITCANNQDLQIDVLANGNVLGTTGVITLPQITAGVLEFEIDFTIKKLGVAGIAAITSSGYVSYIKDASSAYEGKNFLTQNGTTFDTTVLNTLDIQATWIGADPSNSIQSDIFVLSKTY
jgi:hypothetical protein